MAIYVRAYSTPRRNTTGGTYAPSLHLHPGCPGANCDSPDGIAVNHIGEAYAIMRAVRSGLRFEESENRYVRNRVHTFTLSGDVRDEELTRVQVAELPFSKSAPDHPGYADWRAARIGAAKSSAIEEARHIPACLARALGIPGVAEWETDEDRRERAAGAPSERVNDTTAETLSVDSGNRAGEPVYVRVLPARHPVHRGKTVMDVFGHEGYWFTVPGDFPASVPEHLHQTRETFAVFQSPNVVTGFPVWVVRAEGPSGRNLGTSTESRREAVRWALANLAYRRAETARKIGDKRQAAGLPSVPPVRIAVSESGAWVLHVRCRCAVPQREAVGDASTVGGAAELFADDPAPWTLCAEAPVSLRDDHGTPYAWVMESGGRTPDGEPSLSVKPIGGGQPYAVRLADIGARNI
ncbi:hypothetical protein ACFV42_23055 [Streptomyces solisilvae]|uniref:hypothetical protein n=1 Tax=Streptomyces malaysiensis TaxID=92644 RepID=UPI00367ECB67